MLRTMVLNFGNRVFPLFALTNFACLRIFLHLQIMCCILVARQGLSETELKAILNISDQMWAVVFFAIEEFILERSGLLG